MRPLILLLAVLLVSTGAPAQHEQRPHEHGEKDDHAHDATATHSFDEVEKWVKVFDDPERDAWQKPDAVVKFLGVSEEQAVADLGAGTGYFTMFLARAVSKLGRVYAIDIEPNLIEHVTERARKAGLEQVVPVLAEPDDPKLAEASVDLVFVCDTWHHIDDRLVYLAKLAKTLRPDGRLAIIDYHDGELPVGPPPGHKLSRQAVLDELDEAGWALADESDTLPYQYLLVFTPPVREPVEPELTAEDEAQ